jgi:hypothetical protein
MPTNPLAAALVSGNETNVLGLDPNALQANADIQLGQQMQQAGLSAAPAYWPQALARVLEAASGTLLKESGVSDLAKAISGGVEAGKKIFDETTPIGKGLRSDVPLMRAIAFQQIPTAFKLNSEMLKLSPPETATQFGGARPTATGSPALAGAVAGEEAKRRAPYEPGGDVTVQTPTGPQQIPATAATRAAIQPNVRPSALSTPPSPTAAIPPPEPKAEPVQSPIPGTSVAGKPLPNPAIDPAVKADTEELAKDREAATKGQQDMATVRMIHDFLPEITTGWSAETKLEGARILKAAGVPDDKISEFMKTDVASGQILQKKFLELSAGAARGMGAREPGSVIQLFGKAYPNLGTDPQAVVLHTNALYMDRLRAQHLAQEKTNYLNDSINGVQGTGRYRGLKGFNEEFNKSHSPEAYLSAAEVMSGRGEPWSRVTSTAERNAIIRLIPAGRSYLAPDGKIHVMPTMAVTGAQQQ